MICSSKPSMLLPPICQPVTLAFFCEIDFHCWNLMFDRFELQFHFFFLWEDLILPDCIFLLTFRDLVSCSLFASKWRINYCYEAHNRDMHFMWLLQILVDHPWRVVWGLVWITHQCNSKCITLISIESICLSSNAILKNSLLYLLELPLFYIKQNAACPIFK